MQRLLAAVVSVLLLATLWSSGGRAAPAASAQPEVAPHSVAFVGAAPASHHHHHHHDDGGHHHDHEEPDGCHHECGHCCVGHVSPVGVTAAASRPVIQHASSVESCVSARVPDGPEGAAPFQVPKA